MPWAVFAPENVPSKNSPAESIRSYGQVFRFEAGKWFEFEDVYKRWYRRDFQDRAGQTEVASGQEIAKDIAARYAFKGFVALELPCLKAEKEEAEAKSRRQNLSWRKKVVQQFELQLQTVRMGKPGRTDPTDYEIECYTVLGLPEPASIEAFRDRYKPAPQEIKIVLPPELIWAIKALPQEVVEKLPLRVGKNGEAEMEKPPIPETLEEAAQLANER